MNSTNFPEISVVIPTRNRAHLLEPLLFALERQVAAPRFEVIAVNDGSTDETEQLLAAWARRRPDWIRVENSGHRGPAAARNAGIREARGRIIAFTDDDCLPEPDWLSQITRGYDREERLAGIGGQILPLNPDSLFSRYQDLVSFRRPHQDSTGITFLLSGNASFRRDRLLEVGGFDEIFTVAAEDVDLSWRLRRRGYALAYAPAAQARHRNITTFSGYLRFAYRTGKGNVLLHRHYPSWYKILRTVWWGRRLFAWLAIPGLARRWRREQGLSCQEAWAFAALKSGQEMIGYLGSLSMLRWIVKGEKA